MITRSTFLAADRITSPRVEELHRYWRDKAGDGSLPARAAIDPIDIRRILPFVVIAEIEAEPLRVRYRLVGTQVVESNGADFTNRYLDECDFAAEQLLLECYQRLVATRAPVFAYYEWHKAGWRKPTGAVGANEIGFFPLSDDGAAVNFAISLADSDVAPFPTRL